MSQKRSRNKFVTPAAYYLPSDKAHQRQHQGLKIMYGYEPGAVWAVTDDENILTREVYARFGLAMYMAQVLEHGMVNAAIVLHTLPTVSKHSDQDSWLSSLEQAFQAGLKLTYGNLLKPLKTSSEFPPALYDRLSAAKEDRDVLAHL